jgi:hypothetical protein
MVHTMNRQTPSPAVHSYAGSADQQQALQGLVSPDANRTLGTRAGNQKQRPAYRYVRFPVSRGTGILPRRICDNRGRLSDLI